MFSQITSGTEHTVVRKEVTYISENLAFKVAAVRKAWSWDNVSV